MRLQQRRERLDAVFSRAGRAFATAIHRRQDRLTGAVQLLNSYSYESVLARGFALVLAEDGTLVKQAAQLTAGDVVKLRFTDATARAVVAGEGDRPAPMPKPAMASPVGQGSLFGG
jgi:exodeoxyribonuclease VII large subunit